MLVELALRDVRQDGLWWSSPTLWRRYDQPWLSQDEPGAAALIGGIQVTYGVPERYSITIYRATVSPYGVAQGWHVERLCNEALAFAGLTLADCPRADLKPPPPPFRMT